MHMPTLFARAAGYRVAIMATGLGLVLAGTAKAQGTVTAGAEIGIRGFTTEPAPEDKARMLLYSSLHSGVLGQSLAARWTSADSFKSVQLYGNLLGEVDQSLSLRANNPGKADLQLRWDRVPHVFSTNARFLGNETSPGVYTLPTPRPDSAMLANAGYAPTVRTRWDPVKASLSLTPSAAWAFKADFTHIAKTGDRPMSMAFGGPSNNFREILEPIDQTVQGLRLSQSYVQKRFMVQAMYDLSVFTNALQSVTSDNPRSTVDSLRAASAAGRMALAPDNRAQTFTGSASLELPRHTRITGTAAFGVWTQNQAFIPATINTADRDSLARGGFVFPTSLDGRIHTSMVNFTLNSRPIRNVSFNGSYRSYAYKDLTPDISTPITVVNDRTITAGVTERDLLPWSRNNAMGSATWRLPKGFSATGSYTWERMNRDTLVRNVAHVTDKTPRLAIDYNGLAWLTLRASYSHMTRRGTLYRQMDASELPDARKFDEADRNRNRLSFLVTANPVDQVTLMATFDIGRDTFPNSLFGVQSDKNQSFGGDIDYSPNARISVGGGFVREWNDNQFNGSYRTGSTPATLANPTWNWIATNFDTSTTAYASITATLVPNRLMAGGNYEISKSNFRMMATNPVTPSGGTTSQNTAATAVNFPEATQEFKPVSLYLRYIVSKDWGVTARYTSETYAQYNFATTNVSPATGIFSLMGNDLLPYSAKYFTVLVSYRPGLLRNTRAAM